MLITYLHMLALNKWLWINSWISTKITHQRHFFRWWSYFIRGCLVLKISSDISRTTINTWRKSVQMSNAKVILDLLNLLQFRMRMREKKVQEEETQAFWVSFQNLPSEQLSPLSMDWLSLLFRNSCVCTHLPQWTIAKIIFRSHPKACSTTLENSILTRKAKE